MSRFTTRHFLLISLFFTSVSGAYLQYGSIRLFPFASPRNVTLTVGKSETVFCLQLTGPVPTAIQWYNPQGQLLSRTSRDDVHQFVGGGGKVAHLKFKSYNHSHGGKYECRVAVPGKNVEKLSVHIDGVVPDVDIHPSPVNWDNVCELTFNCRDSSQYINYKGLIINKRTPDLFPHQNPCSGLGRFVRIGGLYVHNIIANGMNITERRVYFEASNPKEPIMRVPESLHDEDKVVRTYGWDRINFVYQDLPLLAHHGGHAFQMFTPANSNTYGIPTGLDAHNGSTVVYFAELPAGSPRQAYFTYFHIRTGHWMAPITNEMETLGLYVDIHDGWKVKITTDTNLWNEFSISRSSLSPHTHRCQ